MWRKVLAVRTLICCAVLFAVCGANASAQDDDVYGFTTKQLQSALVSSGLAPQRLYSVQTFGSGDTERPAYMAVLSSSRSGWHVTVFHRVQEGFKVEWSSHQLPVEFSVSSPDNFSVEDIGDESTVRFSGCAPHRCAGDYEGFLLYSTLRKQAFFALLTQQENQPRRVTFSPNALQPMNQNYKDALQRTVDEVVRRTELK
ncbi:MAG: hypothetical protein LAN63_18160 [Acidobacteriia bacterium]|nr:hypothetical protein [Terriglobia bacterium]